MAERLIITGFMGSGKSSVGRELARRLGWRFRDADAEAESQMGMTVSEAFERIGEAGFREVEAGTVARLITEADDAREGTVIALGGGAVTSQRVLDLLASEPLVVHIDVDVDTAFGRAADGSRPLASDREAFRRLYEERQSLYRQAARISLDSRGFDIPGLSQRIMEIIGKVEIDNP